MQRRDRGRQIEGLATPVFLSKLARKISTKMNFFKSIRNTSTASFVSRRGSPEQKKSSARTGSSVFTSIKAMNVSSFLPRRNLMEKVDHEHSASGKPEEQQGAAMKSPLPRRESTEESAVTEVHVEIGQGLADSRRMSFEGWSRGRNPSSTDLHPDSKPPGKETFMHLLQAFGLKQMSS